MKFSYGSVVALALFSACTSLSKKTIVAESVETVQTTAQSSKTFSPQDYDAFMMAALDDQIEIVKSKIAEGYDVNYANEEKRTAIMLAAFNGHTDIIQLLLDAGANVSLVDMTNRSALMFACTGPFVEAVDLLIAAGADVNAIDSHEDWTPVMFAAGEGQIEVIKRLVAAGADINKVDVDGESAYDFAIKREHTETAAYLQSLAQQK